MRATTAKWVRITLLAAVALAVIGGSAPWDGWRSARSQLSESRCGGHASFVHSEWMDTTLTLGRLAVRGCTVGALLERFPLRGMTRAQVVELIGKPTERQLFKEHDMVYWLGPEPGLTGTDAEFLVAGSRRVDAGDARPGPDRLT